MNRIVLLVFVCFLSACAISFEANDNVCIADSECEEGVCDNGACVVQIAPSATTQMRDAGSNAEYDSRKCKVGDCGGASKSRPLTGK